MDKLNSKKIIFFSFTILFLFILSSCGTTKITEPRQPDESFLADIDSFKLGEINILAGLYKKSASATQIYLYCYPKSNSISAVFTIGMDKVEINFNYKERQLIKSSFDLYLNQINEKRFENRKATKKNSYSNSIVDIGWGVFGINHFVTTSYFTNYSIIDKNKPYFVIQVETSNEYNTTNGQTTASPSFDLYLSPAQIKKIKELCSQEVLLDYIESKLNEAYSFDSDDYLYDEQEIDIELEENLDYDNF